MADDTTNPETPAEGKPGKSGHRSPVGPSGKTREQIREEAIARLRPHWWKPGQCGNPNPTHQRRFKLSKILRDVLSGELDDKSGRTAAEACIEELVKEALAGKEWASKILFDRTDGPLRQAIDLEGNLKVKRVILHDEAAKEPAKE